MNRAEREPVSTPRPLKILFLTPFPERLSGSDEILWSYLQHTDRGRFDHTVVIRGNGAFVGELDRLGIRTVTLPDGRLRQLRHTVATIRRLAAILKRERPDLIVNWVTAAQLYGAPAAMLAGAKDRLIWWQLDVPTAPPSRLGGAMAQLATVLPAKAIGGCSQAVADSQATIWPHRPTFAVLPGIDPPRSTSEDGLSALRVELEVPMNVPVVGTVGRLFAWKGHHRLLRALAILRDRGLRFHGLFVGGGGYRADPAYERFLMQLVDELSLAEMVTFTGQVGNATPYIQLMDAFVNASGQEPFGIAVLEAMALGVPVVAPDAAGPAEILEDGRSGLLAPTSEPEELATRVRLLLEDGELRSRIAEGGRERFEQRFTAKQMALQMDSKLAELCRH